MKVYISGGINGYPDLNKKAFAEAEEYLEKEGYTTANPHKIGNPKKSRQENLCLDIKELCDCDALYMLKNWDYSKGARLEYEIAVATGKAIMFEHYTDDIAIAIEQG